MPAAGEPGGPPASIRRFVLEEWLSDDERAVLRVPSVFEGVAMNAWRRYMDARRTWCREHGLARTTDLDEHLTAGVRSPSLPAGVGAGATPTPADLSVIDATSTSARGLRDVGGSVCPGDDPTGDAHDERRNAE